MPLDRAAVGGVLGSILLRAPEAEIRLVGTASSVLRGIDVPAADIDLLFRDRADIDAWFGTLSVELAVDQEPEWIAETQQYFARMRAGDVVVELSTVEIASDADTFECFGAGPWRHFDVVPCGPATVPAVTTELRLLTEIARARTDVARRLIEYLRAQGCDVALVARGMADLGVAQRDVERVLAALSG